MTYFLVNILLAFLWASLQQFRPIDLIGGFILGYGLIWMSHNWLGEEAARYAWRMPLLIGFLIYYLGELLLATWEVIRALFRDQSTLHPAIIAYPLEANTDLEIVLLNNLIMLTPGSMGVDLSPDRKVLYVHFLDAPDPEEARNRIRTGLERRLLEVLR